MRIPILALVLGASLLGGCRGVQRTFGLGGGAHRSPATTSVWGDWVLGSAADSTAFSGATSVHLSLQPTAFTITAAYPGRAPLVVTGGASLSDAGQLTLTPTSGGAGTPGQVGLAMAPGQPLTLLASAAGNTLVFAPPSGGAGPSSVWHRRAAAEAAGVVGATAANPTP